MGGERRQLSRLTVLSKKLARGESHNSCLGEGKSHASTPWEKALMRWSGGPEMAEAG